MTFRDGARLVEVTSGIGDPATQTEGHASGCLAGRDGFDPLGYVVRTPPEFLLKLPDQCCRLRFVGLLKGPPGGQRNNPRNSRHRQKHGESEQQQQLSAKAQGLPPSQTLSRCRVPSRSSSQSFTATLRAVLVGR